MAERIFYARLESPWGKWLVASTRRGVCLVQLGSSLARARAELDGRWGRVEWVESRRENRAALAALRRYFRGGLRRFRLPVDLRGSRFQLAAWRALARIPYGNTRSYKELARAAGRPRAFRAAGMACRSNRLPIIVPCHRVVGSDGSLTGFSPLKRAGQAAPGGLRLKQRLLAHERHFKTLRGSPQE